MRGFDFIGLYETWVEEIRWKAIKERLPKTHEWGCRFAERIRRKGRTSRDMIIGKRKGWGEVGNRLIQEAEGRIIRSEIKEKSGHW